MTKNNEENQNRHGSLEMPEAHLEELLERARMIVTTANDNIRDRILKDKPTDERSVADEIVTSRELLQKYATLHWDHFKGIMKAQIDILSYHRDKTRQRPLNLLLQAPPGSGKSHFVKCVAATMDNVKVISFNMAGATGVGDLAVPLEYARNSKIDGNLPLLFLDEFDTNEKNYGVLLPLLWDGELTVASHVLRLGRAVIVLAGSGKVLSEAVKAGKNTQQEDLYKGIEMPAKLLDLLSRINGPELEIPPLDDKATEIDRSVDKVCIAVLLLLKRFPYLETVPWALLHFIGRTKYRHGVRSISHIVDLIDNIGNQKELKLESVRLPFKDAELLGSSGLIRHLRHDHGDDSLVAGWKEACTHDVGIRIVEPSKDDLEDIIDIIRGM